MSALEDVAKRSVPRRTITFSLPPEPSQRSIRFIIPFVTERNRNGPSLYAWSLNFRAVFSIPSLLFFRSKLQFARARPRGDWTRSLRLSTVIRLYSGTSCGMAGTCFEMDPNLAKVTVSFGQPWIIPEILEKYACTEH